MVKNAVNFLIKISENGSFNLSIEYALKMKSSIL